MDIREQRLSDGLHQRNRAERRAVTWGRAVSEDAFTFGELSGISPITRRGQVGWVATLVFLVVTLLGGCHSQKSPGAPVIEFTKIPPAAQGGRERTDVISGRVEGAGPNQRIVVYAKSGTVVGTAMA